MNNELNTTSELYEKLRAESINEIAQEKRNLLEHNQLEFVKVVMRRFLEKKIEAFPVICEIARIQNLIKRKEVAETGYKGKYTNSIGWSKDGNFKWNYEIPQELHSFMVNVVYTDFWTDDNAAIRDAFMRKLINGEDANSLLAWVTSIYGRAGNNYGSNN